MYQVKTEKEISSGLIHPFLKMSLPMLGNIHSAYPNTFSKQPQISQNFNKNNLKISYCCMPNINSIINMHNKRY